MTITARTCKELTEALARLGFFLVADLPRPLRVDMRPGLLIARMS